MIKLPWTKTKIEETLTNEPDQHQRDKGSAWHIYQEILERDPRRAEKMLAQWEQWEREAVNQWQSNNS